MSWRQSEGSTIVEYNDQFMNPSRVDEIFGRTFQLPGVIDIVLKDKHSGVAVIQLESTGKKALKNKVPEQVLAVIFIENSNRRIYYDLLKTLEMNILWGRTTNLGIWPPHRSYW